MNRKIRKTVFPVAGSGTRFLSTTRAMPKELLPMLLCQMGLMWVSLGWLKNRMRMMLIESGLYRTVYLGA
jgi:hypothetical protein